MAKTLYIDRKVFGNLSLTSVVHWHHLETKGSDGDAISVGSGRSHMATLIQKGLPF